jgi:hypothetical protein
MHAIKHHLLLIACSQRKRLDPEPLPALERYDGNTYRVIRKLRREDRWPFLVDVVILSAEFGLIDADQPIPYYERRMDQARAAELRPTVLATLQERLDGNRQYASVYVELGQDYLPAIDGIDSLCNDTPIVYAQGRIGRRLSSLKQWLEERWREQPTVPFFVADRPMSLRILKGLPLQQYPGARIGIMAHANTTSNFQQAFQQYPCDNLDYCDAVGSPCQYKDDIYHCPVRQYIMNHTVKMCDSGIFTREGATLTYDQLFEAYDRMGVEYGVMIDVFRDPQATLKSAEEALEAYEPFKDSFTLVSVAQGDSLEDYLDCYAQLRRLGFSYIAVGGLLRRRKNTVRFPYVRGQGFMFQVLRELRQRYPNDWLFALGCLHPSRLSGLKELNVWADYKGWIFQYEKRNETLNAHLEVFALNHLEHLDGHEIGNHVSTLQWVVSLRKRLIAIQGNLSQQLFDGRRTLRTALSSLYQELQDALPNMAARFREIITHGLLDSREENLVSEALQSLGKQGSEEASRILGNIRTNHELKRQVKSAENRINQVNTLLAKRITSLKVESAQLPKETQQLCTTIGSLIEKTEREHRFEQVRGKIAEGILALL